METLDIIARLDALLADERAAIARLDGNAVTAIAVEKKTLAEALEGRPASERKDAAQRLTHLVSKLKSNGVLLAQARGILSDLLRGHGVTMRRAGGNTLRPLTASAARHLSVRG